MSSERIRHSHLHRRQRRQPEPSLLKYQTSGEKLRSATRSSQGGIGISSRSCCQTSGRKRTGVQSGASSSPSDSSSEARCAEPVLEGSRCRQADEDATLQLLNVQVPFFFKGIVDALNVEIDPTSGQGVFAIAGTVIIGCTSAFRGI